MAETRLANVVVPEVFNPYVMQRSLNMNRFFQAGILTPNALLSSLLAGPSKTFNFPYWGDLSGDSEVLSETGDMTVNAIAADKMIAIRQIRGKAWGSNDFAAQLAGDDPYAAIGDRVAGYWAAEYEKALMYAVRGVIADNVAANSSDLVVDIAIEDGNAATAANKISAEKTIDAVMKQGDMFSEVTAIAMHSVVYTTLVKNDLIDYTADSDGKMTIPRYMGLSVIVSDTLPAIAGVSSGYKYHSYLFKPGAIAWGENPGSFVPNEVYRDPKGMGIDSLFTRRQFCIHPLGFSWNKSSNTATTPAYSDLYAATSWGRMYEAKNCGIIALVSNG